MRYFPLTSAEFAHSFGIKALRPEELVIEATDRYDCELSQIRLQLESSPELYFAAEPDSVEAQREAADYVLDVADFLSPTDNYRTREPIEIDEISRSPLLSTGRHVQEDLVVCEGTGQFRILAGKVCFPSGWSIAEKLRQGLMTVHAPVPDFAEALGSASLRLMHELKPGRPVWRMNWGVRPSGRLDQTPDTLDELRGRAESMTADRAGQECYFRVERQTLSRLPKTGTILFTIHTHQTPLEKLTCDQKELLAGNIHTCPEHVLAYKGILAMREAVLSSIQR